MGWLGQGLGYGIGGGGGAGGLDILYSRKSWYGELASIHAIGSTTLTIAPSDAAGFAVGDNVWLGGFAEEHAVTEINATTGVLTIGTPLVAAHPLGAHVDFVPMYNTSASVALPAAVSDYAVVETQCRWSFYDLLGRATGEGGWSTGFYHAPGTSWYETTRYPERVFSGHVSQPSSAPFVIAALLGRVASRDKYWGVVFEPANNQLVLSALFTSTPQLIPAIGSLIIRGRV